MLSPSHEVQPSASHLSEHQWLFEKCKLALSLLYMHQLTIRVLQQGHHLLYSTEMLRSPVVESVTRLAHESSALFLICAAVQAHLSGLREETTLGIYNESLIQYQHDLQLEIQVKEGTLMAGALLCTFGVRFSTRSRTLLTEVDLKSNSLDNASGWPELPPNRPTAKGPDQLVTTIHDPHH